MGIIFRQKTPPRTWTCKLWGWILFLTIRSKCTKSLLEPVARVRLVLRKALICCVSVAVFVAMISTGIITTETTTDSQWVNGKDQIYLWTTFLWKGTSKGNCILFLRETVAMPSVHAHSSWSHASLRPSMVSWTVCVWERVCLCADGMHVMTLSIDSVYDCDWAAVADIAAVM